MATKAGKRNPGYGERKHELLDNLEKAVGKNPEIKQVPGEINNAELYELVQPLKAEKTAWAKEKVNEIFEPDEYFITNPGRDRYAQKAKLKPYKAEEVAAYMKKQGGRGAEGGMQAKTAGGVRAYTTQDLKSLDAMRARKDQLVSAEDMAEFKVTSDNALDDLQEAFKNYYEYDRDGWRYGDEFREMVQMSETGSIKNAMKEVGFKDVPEDLIQELEDYKDTLRTGLTEYFEAKPERVVGFDEFGGAIVPEGTPKEVLDILERDGVKVSKYTTDEERTALRDNYKDLMFNFIGGAGVGGLAIGGMTASPEAEAGGLAVANKLRKAAEKASLDPDAIKVSADGYIKYPLEYIDPLSKVGAGDIRREVALNNDAVLGTSRKADFTRDVKHGTGNLENLAEGFDPSLTGQGADQYGSGFYNTNKGTTASGYAVHRKEPGMEKLGGEGAPGVFVGKAALKNPLVIDGGRYANLDQALELSKDQVRKMLDKSQALKRGMDDENMNPAGDHFDSFWSSGEVEDWMLDDLAERYAGNNVTSIEAELFDNDAQAFRDALSEVTGHDGVVVNFPETGEVHTVAWKPEQLRADTAAFDPQFKDSAHLLGNIDPKMLGTLAAGGTAAAAIPVIQQASEEFLSLDNARNTLTKTTEYLKRRAGREYKDSGKAQMAMKILEPMATVASVMVNESLSGISGMVASATGENGAGMVEHMQENLPIYTPKTEAGAEGLEKMGEVIQETTDYWTGGEGGQAMADILSKSEITRGFNPMANFNESADYLNKQGSKIDPRLGAAMATTLKILPETF